VANDPSYLVGPMFHGTRVGTARLISGLRPENAPKQEPVLRTSFNVGGTKDRDYPKRFGPGLYLTDKMHDAVEYAKADGDTGAAVVEGRVKPSNPIHLTQDEFDDIGISKSSESLVQGIQRKNPKYSHVIHSSNIIKDLTSDDREMVRQTKNFTEMSDSFQHTFSDKGNDTFSVPGRGMPMPTIRNNTIITGGHRAAANIQLRGGHDYMHITSHDPLWDDKDSQYGVLLRPNLRGYPAIFKARAVHFYDSVDKSRNQDIWRTENL